MDVVINRQDGAKRDPVLRNRGLIALSYLGGCGQMGVPQLRHSHHDRDQGEKRPERRHKIDVGVNPVCQLNKIHCFPL